MWRNISELLFHGIKILRMDLINIPWETTFSHVILIPPCFKNWISNKCAKLSVNKFDIVKFHENSQVLIIDMTC
jgi:hypothetical protein